MRYLAISLLSLITSTAAPNALPTIASTALIEVVAPTGAHTETLRRGTLTLFVGTVLVTLQLRRRQKSFGMPRAI